MKNNPNKLYKNRDKALISGVCAGLSDYFSVDVKIVRVIFFVLGLFQGFLMILIYIAAAIYLDPRPDNLYQDPAEEKFWRSFRRAPSAIVDNIHDKFEHLDMRLQKLEAQVTSRRYQLDKEFRKL